jgi:hypothetical protein
VDCYYKTYILQLRELEVDSQLQLELHSSAHQHHGEREHLADTFDGSGQLFDSVDHPQWPLTPTGARDSTKVGIKRTYTANCEILYL